MKHVLADTGVWLALFDGRDQYHNEAQVKAQGLERFRLVLPWPTLYETLRTRFVRDRRALSGFERYLKRPNVTYLDDQPYRDEAFRYSMESSLRLSRPLSMADCAIRLILDDVDTKIDYLITFNQRDFIDVCQRRRIELI